MRKTFDRIELQGIRRKLNGSEIVSMNVWGFLFSHRFAEMELTNFLADLKESDLTEFYLPAAIDAGIKSEKSGLEFTRFCLWME